MSTLQKQTVQQAKTESWFLQYFSKKNLNLYEWSILLTAIQELKPSEQNKVRRHLGNISDPIPYLTYLRDGFFYGFDCWV